MLIAGKRGVIWDMDGTLVDTAELHFEAWAATAREFGKPFTRSDFEATFGRRNPDIIHQLLGPGLSEREVTSLADRKEELYRSAARRGIRLLPGARQLLEGLRTAGYRQAIGSSAPRENLVLILELTQTKAYFDAVVSMEDTQKGKPDPQVFLVAAGRLQLPPPCCLVVEDAVAGVEAAKAGGMKCIAVRYVGHHSEESFRRAGADLVTESLENVSVEMVEKLF